MEKGRFAFVAVVLLLGVLGARGENVDAHCDVHDRIDLSQLKIDLLWVEPQEAKDVHAVNFLNIQRDNRLLQLRDWTVRRFKSPTYRMVGVSSAPAEGTKCLEVSKYVDRFAKRPVKQGEYVEAMLKGVALAARPQSFPDGLAVFQSDKKETLRLVVVFAEYFFPGGNDEFTSDGSETCNSAQPTLQRLKEVLALNSADLLLVTMDPDLVKYWKDAFDADDALLLEKKVFEEENPDKPETVAWNHRLSSLVVDFVEKRSIRAACKRFSDHIKHD